MLNNRSGLWLVNGFLSSCREHAFLRDHSVVIVGARRISAVKVSVRLFRLAVCLSDFCIHVVKLDSRRVPLEGGLAGPNGRLIAFAFSFPEWKQTQKMENSRCPRGCGGHNFCCLILRHDVNLSLGVVMHANVCMHACVSVCMCACVPALLPLKHSCTPLMSKVGLV